MFPLHLSFFRRTIATVQHETPNPNTPNPMLKTRVAFRILPEPDYFGCPRSNVIALFPDEQWGYKKGEIASYMRLGQHAPARASYVEELQPATPDEYAGLLAELRSIYEYKQSPGDVVIRLEVMDAPPVPLAA